MVRCLVLAQKVLVCAGQTLRQGHPGLPAQAVQALAEKHGVSINEVVLSYLLSQPNQTIAIFGASSPEQITDSVKAAALKLTADELAQLRVG